MKKHSKRYNQSEKQLDKKQSFTLTEAAAVLKKMAVPKFDASVDLHFLLNVDPKQSNQMVRGTVMLPHGTGKKVRIAAFCKGESQSIAKEAGADHVGAVELIEQVAKGFLDFDCAIATPEIMKDLAKLGKVLGPRGLMPSPKAGTVTNDVKKAIEDLKKGKIEFKLDKQSGIHVSVGRVSFNETSLCENANRAIEAITEAKPSTAKGKYIKTLYISSTMNPGLCLQV